MRIRDIHTPYRHWVAGFLVEVAAFVLYMVLVVLTAAFIAAWL